MKQLILFLTLFVGGCASVPMADAVDQQVPQPQSVTYRLLESDDELRIIVTKYSRSIVELSPAAYWNHALIVERNLPNPKAWQDPKSAFHFILINNNDVTYYMWAFEPESKQSLDLLFKTTHLDGVQDVINE